MLYNCNFRTRIAVQSAGIAAFDSSRGAGRSRFPEGGRLLLRHSALRTPRATRAVRRHAVIGGGNPEEDNREGSRSAAVQVSLSGSLVREKM